MSSGWRGGPTPSTCSSTLVPADSGSGSATEQAAGRGTGSGNSGFTCTTRNSPRTEVAVTCSVFLWPRCARAASLLGGTPCTFGKGFARLPGCRRARRDTEDGSGLQLAQQRQFFLISCTEMEMSAASFSLLTDRCWWDLSHFGGDDN